MSAFVSGLVAGGLVMVCGVATAIAARRAGSAGRRAGVIGRVAGAAPPGARPVRLAPVSLLSPPTRIVRLVDGVDLPLPLDRAWRLVLIGGGVGLVAGTLMAGPVLGLITCGAVVGVPVGTVAALRSRADAAYDATLAEALEAIGRSVRSGGSLPQSVGEAASSVRGHVAKDLARVAAGVARGRSFADGLRDWRDARPRPAVRLVVGALTLATTTGGPPARVVEEVALAIRTRLQLSREASALAAQARLSALVVGVAPLGFMAVMCLTDPRNAQMLFGTPIGIACVVVGLVLDAVGATWMHHMSNRVLDA